MVALGSEMALRGEGGLGFNALLRCLKFGMQM